MPELQPPTNDASSAVTAGPAAREPLAERFSRTRAYQDLPHTCRCGARWSGSNTCHAACCHLTFSGVESFDIHRRGGDCKPPASVGLQLVDGRAYECWGKPEPVTP